MDSSNLLNLANLIDALIPFIHPHLLAAASFVILGGLYLFNRPTNHVYLLDFSCYRPPDFCRIPRSTFIEHAHVCPEVAHPNTVEFQVRVMERSGLGNATYVPAWLLELPPDLSFRSSHLEVKTVAFDAVEDLLDKNKIDPMSVDALITSCSLFCPTPSMAALIINRFGLRSNVMSFHLSGMGCSSSLKSIDLARDLLKVHDNILVLVVSMEAVTPNGYKGKIKSMLLANCLFRMGGVASLLSNRKQDRPKARYVLQHLVSTHMGSKDKSFGCVKQDVDSEGHIGLSLSRDIFHVAVDTIDMNFRSLGPLVLPYTQQFLYVWWAIRTKLWWPTEKISKFMPDFNKAVDHFCIHVGGKTVIDAIEEALGLSKKTMEASRMTLYRFGNTSSSSIWYSFCYLEAKGRIKIGDRVLQLTFGSGFKCYSAVWKCLLDTGPKVTRNPWTDEINLYPVDPPPVLDH